MRRLSILVLSLTLAACQQGEPNETPDEGRGPLGAADAAGSCVDPAGGDFCGGPTTGACWCDELCVDYGDCCADVEPVCGVAAGKKVEVRAVIAGEQGSSRAAGESSWQAACDTWAADLADRTAGTFLDYDCGAPENMLSSAFLFRSTAVATIEVEAAEVVEADVAPAASTKGDNLAPAHQAWSAACSAAIESAAQRFGDRFIGAGCQEPSNLLSSSFYYESPVRVWLTALPGAIAEVQTTIYGGLEGALVDGHRSWVEACEAWATKALERGNRVSHYTCGAASNSASSSFMYESTATIVVAHESGPPRSIALRSVARRSPDGSRAGSLGAWAEACDELLDTAAAELGSRFLGGGCAAPENIASSGFFFQSPVTVLAAPPTGDTLEVPMYLDGPRASSLWDGLQNWESRCDALRAKLMNHFTGAIVSGIECGTPENWPYSGFLYQSEGTATFTMSLAEDQTLEEITTPLSASAGGLADASAAWQAACDAQLDAWFAEFDYDLAAVTCGIPEASGSWRYDSTATAWVIR